MATSPSESGKVQHLTKASSDELLRKFAVEEPGEEILLRRAQMLLKVSLARRKKKSARRTFSRPAMACYMRDDHLRAERISEWKGLLQPSPLSRRSSIISSGISKKMRASDVFLHTVEKTWQKMVEGATRMAMEGHYSQHVRLIGDTS